MVNGTQMAQFDRRLRNLERNLAGFQEITGICTKASQHPVDIVATEYDVDTGLFTITFSSLEGQRFQVQVSTDSGVTWTIAADNVLAADSPAIVTDWISAAYELDDFPVFFRVRRYPALMTPCTPIAPTCPDILSPIIT